MSQSDQGSTRNSLFRGQQGSSVCLFGRHLGFRRSGSVGTSLSNISTRLYSTTGRDLSLISEPLNYVWAHEISPSLAR